MNKLSVIMPVYNERDYVAAIVERVLAQPFDMELVIVDDASTDGTRDILSVLAAADDRIRVIEHPRNRGKGAAMRTGVEQARGDVVLVQDADLEYSPKDYPAMLQPIIDDEADVVFGSRFLGGPHRVLYYWHSVFNFGITRLTNMVTNLNLTDIETGYKAFRREVLAAFDLEEERFGIEPEVTIKLSRVPGVRVWEVPISYAGRTYAEGKKIGIKDAFRALYVVGKYGLVKRGRGR